MKDLTKQKRPQEEELSLFSIVYGNKENRKGGIAQLARASALQAGCPGFESPCLQYLIFEKLALGTERIIWSSEKGSTEEA